MKYLEMSISVEKQTCCAISSLSPSPGTEATGQRALGSEKNEPGPKGLGSQTCTMCSFQDLHLSRAQP